MVVFCRQSAAILRHLLYHIGNFHPLFTRHVVGSVGDVGLLLRFPCFSELVCRKLVTVAVSVYHVQEGIHV